MPKAQCSTSSRMMYCSCSAAISSGWRWPWTPQAGNNFAKARRNGALAAFNSEKRLAQRKDDLVGKNQPN